MRAGFIPWLLCLVVFVAMNPWGRRAHASDAPTYLVAIGNNAGASDEVELLYAERDAREVARTFQDLGNVSGQRLLLLTGESADTVRTALLELNAAIRSKEQSQAHLIVFYSGHADAQALHMNGTDFPFSELKTIVKGSTARVRLLVVDACRSGAVTRVKGVTAAPEFTLTHDTGQSTEGMAVLTSSAAGENSQESDHLRGSFFSHHLVSGLRGAADKNQDGAVSLDEAYAYTYTQTLKSSGRSLELQHPTFEYGLKGKGSLVLTRPLHASGSTGTLRIEEHGRYLVTEGGQAGPVAMELAVSKKGATVALPHRKYFVQRRGRRSYREYEVAVKRGATTVLKGHPYRTIAYDRLVRKGGGSRSAVHGFSVLGGIRGEAISDQGQLPNVVLGYSVDWAAASLGFRGRWSWTTLETNTELSRIEHNELGLGLLLQRFVDFEVASVSLGLMVEGIRMQQAFDGRGTAPVRESYAVGYGALLGLEIDAGAGIAFRIEGGPVSYVFRKARDSAGEAAEAEVKTPLTWASHGGLVVRL